MSRSDIQHRQRDYLCNREVVIVVFVIVVIFVVFVVFVILYCSLFMVPKALVSVVCCLLFQLFVLSVLSSKNYFGRTLGFKIKKAAGRLVFCCLSAHDVRMCPPVTSVFNRRMMCIENLTCRGSRQKQWVSYGRVHGGKQVRDDHSWSSYAHGNHACSRGGGCVAGMFFSYSFYSWFCFISTIRDAKVHNFF